MPGRMTAVALAGSGLAVLVACGGPTRESEPRDLMGTYAGTYTAVFLTEDGFFGEQEQVYDTECEGVLTISSQTAEAISGTYEVLGAAECEPQSGVLSGSIMPAPFDASRTLVDLALVDEPISPGAFAPYCESQAQVSAVTGSYSEGTISAVWEHYVDCAPEDGTLVFRLLINVTAAE
jgi:hypothetical protein